MKKKLLSVILVILIVIIAIVYFVAFNFDPQNERRTGLEEYFTAMDGKSYADKEAKKWKSDATFKSAWAHQNHGMKDGKFKVWEYNYYSPSTEYNCFAPYIPGARRYAWHTEQESSAGPA